MLSDENYGLCRPILEDSQLEEEDKVEKLEELLRKDGGYSGPALENAVLDALWRHRNGSKGDSDNVPLRHTVIRKSSPAPWQMQQRAPTPIGSPPVAPSPSLSVSRPSFSRQKSSVPSPFASPRPSPRLSFAQHIPHSPSLQAYEFSDTSSTPDIYGDFGSDVNVDWLVSEDATSTTSSNGTGMLSGAAAEWLPQPDMSPYDILRSVLGDRKTDLEIEEALEKHSYDLGATIAALTGGESLDNLQPVNSLSNSSVLVGKSMTMNQVRPQTPNSAKSPIVCKYWLASGSCLRADCRFAHDTSAYLCKYWMAGQCLAGESCKFSHDPSLVMSNLQLNNSTDSLGSSPQPAADNADNFPALSSQHARGSSSNLSQSSVNAQVFVPRGRGGLMPQFVVQRPQSRPTSRHQTRPEFSSSLSMDDQDAFPTLSSLNAKRTSKHHGQRPRHGHGGHQERESTPSSMADIVKFAPNPLISAQRKLELSKKSKTTNGAFPDGIASSATARRIPEPNHIPWLETGDRANQQYLKYRQEAIKHGTIRNKFLQSAAQAWNRNDARAAKALSLRGQAENDAMRKAHREAAKALYEERNQHLRAGSTGSNIETYIDLHGLHPEEAIEYLDEILTEHTKLQRLGIGGAGKEHQNIIYAITGTGHHSKNGKDKVGKSVRLWLSEQGYIFREFSVPGERGGYIGGVLGIDVSSRQSRDVDGLSRTGVSIEDETTRPAGSIIVGSGKIQVLKREDITK